MDIKDKIKKAIKDPLRAFLIIIAIFYNLLINLKIDKKYSQSNLKELNLI